MGSPDSVAASSGAEYLIYISRGAGNEYGREYFVRIINGHVEAYGKNGDFNSTKDPSLNVNIKSN